MATDSIGGQIYTNIVDLPEISEVTAGQWLIVETEEGTSVINFQNFLIGTGNITFNSTIETNTTNIAALSTGQNNTNDQVTVLKGLNGKMTVGYYLSGAASGFAVATTEVQLPINYIQSNTIDGNLANAPSTLNGVTSGSNVVNLNAGSYFVDFSSAFSDKAFVDMYDNTNNQVLLTSDYSATPTMKGIIALSVRTNLIFRAYSNSSITLGERTPFYVSGLYQTPLVAAFQYLSAANVSISGPDART
jgi:hypothetical protein